MASSSRNPVSGAPIFRDEDAPDPAVNPTEVAEYAATVGNRGVGTTAQRNAWPYMKEGFAWGDTTNGNEYVVRNGAWAEQMGGGTTPVLTYDAKWTSLQGDPQVTRVGKLVSANLILKKSNTSGIADRDKPLTFPAGFRPEKTVGGSGFVSGANAPMHVGFQISPSGVLELFFSGTTTETQLTLSITYMAV